MPGDCYWVAWSNTDSWRQMRLSQDLSMDTLGQIEAKGPVDLDLNFEGEAYRSPACSTGRYYYTMNYTWLGLSEQCMDLGPWYETMCNSDGCDRVATLDEMIDKVNASGVGLNLKLTQYLF